MAVLQPGRIAPPSDAEIVESLCSLVPTLREVHAAGEVGRRLAATLDRLATTDPGRRAVTQEEAMADFGLMRIISSGSTEGRPVELQRGASSRRSPA